MNAKNIIAANDGAQMWDVRYKYPYQHSYADTQGNPQTTTYYTHAGAKCVAPTAERAIALIKEFNPEAVILGVHHRDGGEKNRVLIDPAVMPETAAAQKQDPVAWVAFAADGSESQLITDSRAVAEDKAKKYGWFVAPLYRSPTLNDEERWCLKEMLVLIARHHENHQQAAFILRDLLRRSKNDRC